jgi:hypothetical protein
MNAPLPVNVLRYGRDEPLPEPVPLRAGPLSLLYEAGDLRCLKRGEREVIRRVYAAVRDRNWGTVPGVISNLKLEISDEAFHIAYVSEHHQNEVHFVWRGEIVGEADGAIRFTFDGEAKTTFLKNRIGFCVLHPIPQCAGAPCRVEYADGTRKTTAFPKQVSPDQPVKDIHDLGAIAHEVASGVWAEVRFEGDLFEMEDQRNWIDASYKIYCTPLRLPFPVEIKAGTHVQQRVTLRLVGTAASASGAANRQPLIEVMRAAPLKTAITSDAVAVEVLPHQRTRLPALGHCAPSHRRVCTESEVERLAKLKPAHLRVDLTIDESNWSGALWLGAAGTDAGERLELALHLPNVSPTVLKDVAGELANRRDQLARVIVFQDGTESTPERLLKLARKHFADAFAGIPIGAGTNADFYQLNQSRPPHELADFLCWSMNPQVHAFDNASLAETPQAISAQIESAREYFPGKPLVVSPVTLKPRFNPVATGPAPPVPPGELPPQVDPRQMSLLGAGWTLAALKHLAESGVESVTFYETTGWRGVMETEAGSPLPTRFPSIPGGVFPLYHVLVDAGEFAGGEVLRAKSSEPLQVEALALRKQSRLCVLLANLTNQPQVARVLRLGDRGRLRQLDETNALQAMTAPEEFRRQPGEVIASADGEAEIALRPYAVARLDLER